MDDTKHDMEAADWGLRVALPGLMSVLPELDGFVEGEVRSLPPVSDRESAAEAAAGLARIADHLNLLVAECDRGAVRRLDALLQTRSAIAMASAAVELSAHLRRQNSDDQPDTVHEAVQGLAALALALGLEDDDIRNGASLESTASSAQASARTESGPS